MLVGKNVCIRPLESEDLGWFTEWNNDINYTGEYEPVEVSSRHSIEKWFDGENRNSWWIIEDMNAKPLGQIITGSDGNYQFIGYIIHPDNRGNGYCTEAVQLMVDYLFLSKNIVRVQAECNPENKASIRVLEKSGFTFEGVRRKVNFMHGKYNDGAIYSILRDEWTPKFLK
jgi:RimJ/RimL family protein N-acetyltransferase